MATASSSSSSSSLSCCAVPQWEYDVFLSFRGEDTRAGFVSHLHSALCSSGVRVFIDYELERGEKIDGLLESKIESSRIAIVVFSPKFADSTWCLQELTKILEMKHSRGQLVQPVFFHVDPSDVRKQTGVFAEIMARHEEVFGDSSEKVKKWKDALSEVAKLSGWHLGNGLESDLIQKIVEEVSSKLHRPYLDVAKHPVALDKNIQAVRMLLHPEDDSVRVVGIYGIGGIGKTAIAKAIYKMIADQFEGSSFLANIREISRWHGRHKLQEALLRDIMGDKTTKVGYIQIGADLIRQKLCNKRVLLVLDDVGSMDQLRDLMGERSWFGQGSRIILTTRDEQVLVAYGAEIYEVGELNHDDALQLFSWNAFQEPSPTKVYPYSLLSDRFIHCAKGVPLALIVLGSFLCGKSTHEWERTLNRLSATPGDQIDEILKISFDGLETHEQAIFLDIACFFNGEDKIKVIKAFDRCNFYPDSGLQILSQKSLIHMESSKIWMHDLLQEMGREIVRQESPENPGRRSRLWSYEDILRVLQENLLKGTNSIQGIKLDKLELGEVMSMGAKSMEQMKRLRLLMFRDKHLSGCPEYLWNDIRWLWGQGNNLPATVESCGPAQPSIHGSNPTNPAKNEKHHGPIKTILFRFRCKGTALKIWKINCRDALSNFKCIVATPHKLAQFLCLRRSKRGSDSDMPSEEYSVCHCKINCRIALSDVKRVMATVRKLTQFSCFKGCKGSSHNNGIADFDSNLLLEEYSVFKKFSKAQLVRATKNFRSEIGGGSAGSVYRGILEDGQVVAIKWTNVTNKGTRDCMFISEIKTLRHVNHKNVIRLLGFHARRSECALVYEYMCNSSLDNHLHTIGSSTLMSWNARLKVALDVARGIEYLHEFASPRIVHRDIKSSNILLDENWTAKVSDFGFSISLPKGKDYFEDSVVGSIAYLDLEYLCTGRVTTKSDVYSYGIVLLELLSGRKAFQRDKEGPKRYIKGNVVPCILQGQIAQALDPKMPIPALFEMIAVANMAYLAVDCVQERAIDRPSMSCVVDRLRSALAQFPSELCDNTETSRSCKLSPYPSLSCDNIDVYASHNSSLMLEEEITREIT